MSPYEFHKQTREKSKQLRKSLSLARVATRKCHRQTVTSSSLRRHGVTPRDESNRHHFGLRCNQLARALSSTMVRPSTATTPADADAYKTMCEMRRDLDFLRRHRISNALHSSSHLLCFEPYHHQSSCLQPMLSLRSKRCRTLQPRRLCRCLCRFSILGTGVRVWACQERQVPYVTDFKFSTQRIVARRTAVCRKRQYDQSTRNRTVMAGLDAF